MRDRKGIAKDKFLKGFNCSQSVLVAFFQDLGLKEEDLLKISSGFGGGMGRMQNTCGAVTGAFMVLGYLNGRYQEDDTESKAKTYGLIQKFAADFEEVNGTINCLELLGVNFNDEEAMKEVVEQERFKEKCLKYVLDAVEIIESKYL
jgi:C_GCAxxG_C_C family probable redox protein